MKPIRQTIFEPLRKRITKIDRPDYSQLEARNLLSATGSSNIDLTQPQFLQVATEFRQSANLVQNGDFESGDSGATSGFFDQSEVAGWNTTDPSATVRLINFAHERSSVLQVDSSSDIADSVFQDLETESGNKYVLSFEVREQPVDPGAAANTNDVEVIWNQTSLGVYSGIQFWQNVSIHVTAETATDRLEFREVGGTGDGRGPLIDNVLLRAVSDSELVNGGFESPVVNSSVTPATDVEGWNAYASLVADRVLDIRNGAQAGEGSQYLNLDSSDSHLDRIYRDIQTEAGAKYFVSFQLKADGDPADITNQIRARWNDEWAGTFQGGTDWQSFGILVEATSDVTRLVFREPPHGSNDAGTGLGPMLDNVQIYMLDTIQQDLIVDANGSAQGVDTSAIFTEDAGPTILAPQLTAENNVRGNVTSATIKITNLQDGILEVLSADTTGTNISSAYNESTATLRLTGQDTVENYQQVLRTLSYENNSDTPSTVNREVTIVLVDQGVVGMQARVDVSVFTSEDAPVINSVSDQTTRVADSTSFQIVASDPDSNSLTYGLTYTGDAGVFAPTISDTGLVSWRSTKVSDLDITVTVSDDGGASSNTTFKLTSAVEGAFENLPTGFVPFSGNSQLSHVFQSERVDLYASAPSMNIDISKTYEAVFALEDGDITILLDAVNAPITVNNFVNLARDGFYDNLTFHRVINNFVAQGGDPAGNGSGGPGYQFVDEVNNGKQFTKRGQLAMANAGPNTNGSQFFITFNAQPSLTGSHTIFGEVTAGDSVLDQITRRTPDISIPADIIHSVTILET